MIVASIDPVQRTCPIIYSVSNLPHDVFMMIAVPAPVGGVLLFSPNGIIYIDQTSTPGIACAVNKFWMIEQSIKPEIPEYAIDHSESKPSVYVGSRLYDFSSLGISLFDCSATFLNPDTVFIGLKDGKTLLLELIGSEDARGFGRKKSGIKKLNIKQLDFTIPSPADIIRVGGGLLVESFSNPSRVLGSLNSKKSTDASLIQQGHMLVTSNCGDTMLLSVNEIGEQASETILDDDDLAEIYGESLKTASYTTSIFAFKICDKLYGNNATKDINIGECTSYSDFPFESSRTKPQIEMVTCVQQALKVVHRNIRPNILISFDMEGVKDFWSIKNGEFHSFLILSRGDSTIVLETGEELQEVDGKGFHRGKTVSAKSVLGGERIVQVYDSGLLLLDKGRFLLIESQ